MKDVTLLTGWFFNRTFWRFTVKTIFALVLPLSLALLWAVPFFTSGEEVSLGWFAVDFIVVAGTYVMLAYPGLFKAIARRHKSFSSRALA